MHQAQGLPSGGTVDYQESWVQRGQHRIYVRDYPGEAPPVVLLHGFPDNLHLYDRLVPELAGRRLVSFDFLGWGASDKPPAIPTPPPTRPATSTR
jgi:haloalkane dehalogenase